MQLENKLVPTWETSVTMLPPTQQYFKWHMLLTYDTPY